MIHTEEQIIEKAKQVMTDLLDKYYSDEWIDGVLFDEEDTLFSGENKGDKHPIWTVSINSFFDNLDFLYVSDETGEPLYYQNFNTFVFDIEKNPEGKYCKIDVAENRK